ncbi:MAG: hypothetical protein SFZ23_07815 [Planctomycetota bacterium]|nr:hypothetical protein [Planctomycetota bacterium]
MSTVGVFVFALFTNPAAAQPTGCVSQLGHLPVTSALVQGEAPVARDGVLYLVVSTNSSGTDYELLAIDVSDPASPRQVASVDVPNELNCGMPAAISLEGHELYVLTSSGLTLYDVSTPQAPARIRTLSSVALPCGGVNPGLALNDDSLLAISGHVFVIDRSLMRVPVPPPPTPPNNPVVRVLALDGAVPQDVAINQDIAVVSTYAGLVSVDISTPATSVIRETLVVPGFPGTLAFDANGRLFVACNTTDYMVASVRPFANPTPLNGIGTYSVLGNAVANSLYVSCSANLGASVYWISDPANAMLVGSSGPLFAESVAFLGSTLVIASRDDGLFLLDVADCVGNPCPADFNVDGTADFFDYLDFASTFAAEEPAADFNRDGTVDFFDYLDFAQAFDVGC